MVRILVLSAAVLLAQSAVAQAQPTAIAIDGKLNDGSFVSVALAVGQNGQVTGTGVLYGVNPSNGYTYKYPFSISSGATGQGKLTITGAIAGANYPLTITTAVPNGPLVFSYVVNGKTYSLTGQGTVVVK